MFTFCLQKMLFLVYSLCYNIISRARTLYRTRIKLIHRRKAGKVRLIMTINERKNQEKIKQLERQYTVLVRCLNKSEEEIAELNAKVAELEARLIAMDCDRIIDKIQEAQANNAETKKTTRKRTKKIEPIRLEDVEIKE